MSLTQMCIETLKMNIIKQLILKTGNTYNNGDNCQGN